MNEIDAVVTWVDGHDPVHQEKRDQYLKIALPGNVRGSNVDGRYIDAGELKYCLNSIRKFAPWIRNIYLVTDNQFPAWLTIEEKQRLNIHIVDHKEIFRDYLVYLPTFNSISIESLLWTIPGLSNKYIVFSDDVFIIRPVIPDDFFFNDMLVIRGEWKLQRPALFKRILSEIKRIIKTRRLFLRVDGGHITAQINAARLLGFHKKYFDLAHTPFTMLKDIQQEIYKENPELLMKNAKFRFRNKNQYQPISLNAHRAIKSKKAILKDPIDSLRISVTEDGELNSRDDFYTLNGGNKKFLCIQDMPFLNENNMSEIKEYLEKTILS